LDIEYVLKLIANNGFPLVLSVYLVWKLEFFINEIIKNQKEFSKDVTGEIKEIFRYRVYEEYFLNMMNHTSHLKTGA